MKHKTIKGWVQKLLKNGVRRRFLIWMIPLILPKHHLAGNSKGGGRKKKDIVIGPFIISHSKPTNEVANETS